MNFNKSKIIVLNIICIMFITCFSLQEAYATAFGNIDDTNKYAWSENSGWQNFKPTHGGVTVNDTYLEGYAWAENTGWIKLGHTPAGGNYANTNATDWGVNNASGDLSGYAWGENIGWINFNPTHSQVTVDASTGKFDGYAWSENLGWIHFQGTAGDSSTYYVQKDLGTIPTVTTETVSSVGTSTATGNGTVTNLGDSAVTAHGVCWGTSADPDINGDKKDNGSTVSTDAFTASITGLSASTVYHVRAFATNTAGTSYGADVTFTTSAAPAPTPPSPTPPSPTPPSPTPPPPTPPSPPPPDPNPILPAVDDIQDEIGDIVIPVNPDVPVTPEDLEKVDDVVEKVEDVIDVVIGSEEDVPVKDVVDVLGGVKDTLDLLGKVKGTGSDIDPEKVDKVLDGTEKIIDNVLEKEDLTPKEKKEVTDAVSDVVGTLPELIENATPERGLELVDKAGGLIDKGIQAASTVGDIVNLVTDIGNVFQALDIDTTISGNIKVAQKADALVKQTLAALKTASLTDAVKAIAQLQKEVGNICTLMFDNMKLNLEPFSDNLPRQKRNSGKLNPRENLLPVNVQNVKTLMSEIATMLGNIINEDMPIKPDTFAEIQDVMKGAIGAVPDGSIEYLLDTSCVNLTNYLDIDLLSYISKMTSTAVAIRVRRDLPKPLNANKEVLENIIPLSSVLPDCTMASDNGKITCNFDDTEYNIRLKNLYFVPDSFDEQVSFLKSGEILFIKNGMALVFAPTMTDMAKVIKMMEKDSKWEFKDNGTIEWPPYVGTFSYEMTGCEEVFCQALHPIPFNLEAFLGSLQSIDFIINRFTGNIEFNGFAFKPDYEVHPLTTEEKEFVDLNKDSYGVAWKFAGDVNGDGLDDYEMLTSKGRQVFYQVK